MSEQKPAPNRNQELSTAKRALLEKRLSGQLSRVKGAEGIPVYEKTGLVPLSFAQERFWFLHQLDPKSPAYNMYNVVRIQGTLNNAILTESFKTLIQRHQILRTSFVVEDGQPYQKIAPNLPFEISEIELQSQNQNDLDHHVNELINAEIRCPFDLSQLPLLRVCIIRQSDDEHILILTIHHILFDEWSNEVFWRELSAIYRSLSVAEVPALRDLPVQYTDFAIWQKEQIDKQMTGQLEYWKEQLHGELPVIQLPADRPRPSKQTFRGALKWRQLSESLYNQLISLNQDLGTTMFMSLLATFQILLTRYTGQSDILVGTPIANRSRPEIKELIGLFLNTLVLRADLVEDMPFTEFASRIRKEALDAYANQDLPFEKLVDELHPQRDISHNPIFQVMFVHQKSPLGEIDLPGMKVSRIPVDIGIAKFDLTMFAQESDGVLSTGLEYNSDLFDERTADRILQHYEVLLESIVRDPQQRISNLHLITKTERDMILRDWNNTSTGDIPDLCIHQLIEFQAAQKPEATAITDQDSDLSYRQLDQKSNQLAHYLRQQGVSSDVPVGLLLERSTEMFVAILAVLKAGGAYLPLDPDYPQERLAFMLNDAQVRVLVTQERLAGSIPENNAEICFIDRDWDEISRESSANTKSNTTPDNLAYIIYTSGSTGIPRGVPVSHRNLVHSTLARDEFYDAPPNCFLLLSSFTFDSSIAGIFWTLCKGGILVLPPQRIEQDMHRLATIIGDHLVTHTLCLPSLYMLLLELANSAQLASLETVIVAGEACQQELVRRHFAKLPETKLYNEYGPTEASVWSTAYQITSDFVGDRVPIGRPIPNVQNFILDRHGQLAPVTVPGELCIGGPGVTSGYLNAPELTARKFIVRSFEGEPPRRLYCTGDRARFLPDGNIDFLGRIDHQVKIRGNRVELGEIESALNGMPGVREAIVDLRDNRLAAYIIPDSKPSPPDGWRTYLVDRLPDYMIPSSFIALDDFPRTPNGKLDRKALPSPQSLDQSEAFVAPRTEEEKRMAEIWMDILDLDRVGIQDNFFEIGGNSLLSIRIFARIVDQFEVNLPLSTLLTDPTIEQLAAKISDKREIDKSLQALVPIQPSGSKTPFYCVHFLGGSLLGYKDLAHAIGDEQPVLGFQAVGFDSSYPQNTTNTTIEEMASHYIDEMRSYQPKGPYRIGGYCFGGVVAYEMACQLEKMGEQVSVLAIFEGAMPEINLNRVPVYQSIYQRSINLLKGIPVWIKAFTGLSPKQVLKQLQAALKKIWVKLKPNPEFERQILAEGALGMNLNLNDIPDAHRNLIDMHVNANINYVPGKYNGVVTLFRARNRSIKDTIFGSLNPKMGWDQLALGGVKVNLVDGFHYNIHLPPYVESLAAKLKQNLDFEVDVEK